MQIFVMVAIWVILGLLMGVLAGPIWKGRRPIGEFGDYAVAVVLAILTGLGDWYLLPLLGIEGTIKFIAAVTEPALGALLGLWVVRLVKKT